MVDRFCWNQVPSQRKLHDEPVQQLRTMPVLDFRAAIPARLWAAISDEQAVATLLRSFETAGNDLRATHLAIVFGGGSNG